jgi:endonuclease-3
MSRPESPLAKKTERVYELLLATYGERELKPRREPLHELISTMLSHRTTQHNEDLAFKRMWKRFGSWEGVRDAPVSELAETISAATFAETKAANIQKVLTRLIKEHGPSLEFLRDLPPAEGLAWLLSLPGVGIKTASLVLLFCFGKPLLPVDTHVHRVSGRLGLIGPKVTAKAAHRRLLELLPADPHVLYNFHIAMLSHGQRVCIWGKPRCQKCPLTGLCDWYQRHYGDSPGEVR